MSQVFQHVSDTDVVHILAFIGGFIDAAGYLKIKGVFTSSITGNLVVACSSIVHMEGVRCRSLVCLSFVLAGAMAAFAALRLKSYHRFHLRALSLTLFLLQLILFVVIWVLGHYIDGDIKASESIDTWSNILMGCIMGASMGFHNVAAKEAITNCPPTTVMTSTLINVSGNFSNTVAYLLAENNIMPLVPAPPKSHLTSQEKTSYDDKYKDSRGKFLTTVKPLIAFIVGALIGAATMYFGSFNCMAIPLFALVFIMVEIVWKDLVESSKAAKEAAAAASAAPTNEDNAKAAGANSDSSPFRLQAGSSAEEASGKEESKADGHGASKA